VKNNNRYWLILAVFLVTVIILLPAKKSKKVIKPSRSAVQPIKGKIAIVLDDWGYSLDNVNTLKSIKRPLTLAVLPNLNLSKKISAGLHQAGFEIILHLPMQPVGKYSLEENTISTKMSKEQIENILYKDLSSIGYAKGVSNHMGSMATSDLRTMEIVFKYLKKRGLYFLDSFVSKESVCKGLANKVGLRFAKRDIFLDNNSDPEYIRGQVYKLKARAKLKGQAIGIGHDRKNTIQVLKEVLPELEKEGYRFVFVSELTR
jgi:hypothetical protein